MNKKQIMKAFLFCMVFLMLLGPLSYMLRTSGTVKKIFTGFYAEKKNTVDVILIGSSPVYPYYIAPQWYEDYGFTAYPLSSNLQRPRAATHLIKEALKTQEPVLFIFELRQYTVPENAMLENMAYTRGVTDNLKYSWNRIETIQDMVPKDEGRLSYYLDIFKYHSNWRSLILEHQWQSFFYEWEHPLKGYEVNTQIVSGEGEQAVVLPEEVMPIPEDEEQQLYRLLDYLQTEGLDALFIVSPAHAGEEQQKQYHYIRDIVTAYGYGYLNLNDYAEETGIDFATDFYDGGGHTNISGAIKSTDFLGNYLKENYMLPDHRGQAGYESWDSAGERWQKEKESAMEAIEGEEKE